MKHAWWRMLISSLLFISLLPCAQAQEQATMKVIEPTEIQDILANPGMGWQTFHRFADEDQNLRGIPTAAAYYRFGWEELEPAEGKIDFAKFDELLAHAHRAGQKLGFRIMLASTGPKNYAPQWLRDKGVKGWEYSYEGHGRFWAPDLEDPVVKEAHTRLLRELGQRYDGHPDLDYIDIGSVGLWGEWHFGNAITVDTHEQVPLPSETRRQEIIEEYIRYFPKTPKLMLIGDVMGMQYATSHGCGWRADCLGDMGGFSCEWNHMENFYKQQVEKTNASEAWKRGPVAWESCWTMRKWVDEGWDIAFIFDYGLELHGSYLNNKSAAIEDEWRSEIDRFLRRLGYRLVLRRAEHAPAVTAGQPLSIVMEWENSGVAPPYHDYQLAFRLTSPHQIQTILPTHQSIQGWLPGKHHVSATCAVPVDLPTGRYTISLGVVHPVTQATEVRLAIAGRDKDGWYPLSEVEITK